MEGKIWKEKVEICRLRNKASSLRCIAGGPHAAGKTTRAADTAARTLPYRNLRVCSEALHFITKKKGEIHGNIRQCWAFFHSLTT